MNDQPPGEQMPEIPSWWLKPQESRPHEQQNKLMAIPGLGMDDSHISEPEFKRFRQEPPLKPAEPTKEKVEPLKMEPPAFHPPLELPKLDIPILVKPRLPIQDMKVQSPISPKVGRPMTPPPPPAVVKTETATEIKEEEKFNIIHFDPELHWCRVCNVFPRTAKEFLNHLHAPEHKQYLAVSFVHSILFKFCLFYNIK